MDRKSPVKHPVSGHYRGGKWIDKYTRGQGEKPRSTRKSRRRSGTTYNVTFIFPDGSTETYNAQGTATGALRDAISNIQRPMIPERAILRRLQD